jgi:outer membrane protein
MSYASRVRSDGPRSIALFLMVATLGLACTRPPGRGTTPEDEIKIGVIDLDRVLAETARGRDATEQLERFGGQVQEEWADIEADLQERAREIEESRASGASEEELARLLGGYQEAADRAQRTRAARQSEIERRKRELTAPILEDITRIARTIGTRDGFGLIVERASTSFVAPDADLTEAVVAAMAREEAIDPDLDRDASPALDGPSLEQE